MSANTGRVLSIFLHVHSFFLIMVFISVQTHFKYYVPQPLLTLFREMRRNGNEICA